MLEMHLLWYAYVVVMLLIEYIMILLNKCFEFNFLRLHKKPYRAKKKKKREKLYGSSHNYPFCSCQSRRQSPPPLV